MEPVMNDVNCVTDVDARKDKGNIVIGAMLVLTGVAIVADRTGLIQWRDQWTLWPLILGGIGLARFLQSVPGEPKQGLILLTIAAWLLLTEGGWVSMEDSWPIGIIALGLIVALNGGGRRRRWAMPPRPPVPSDPTQAKFEQFDARWKRGHHRHDRTLSPLGVLGVWIAIFVAIQVSGTRSFTSANADTDDRVRVVSVMSRSGYNSRAGTFQGADVTNVMGRSELNLRDAMLAPGASATVHVVSAMGNVTLRIPPAWTVDTGAVSALGKIVDERPTPAEADTVAGPAPRLVLRGLVMFGRLIITS
jgi:Domain of unknown function (DUF5668)